MGHSLIPCVLRWLRRYCSPMSPAQAIAGIIDYVLKMQREDGGWNAYPFYNVSGLRGTYDCFLYRGAGPLPPAGCKSAIRRHPPQGHYLLVKQVPIG